ncbi:type I addiction module toxin, SymE family [Hahella sp. KA22]|uniref:SymE family type I addiction module toxin n=1 Tax=unclassified Hahella TaxID=2624107 RepID=UPI000FDEDD93|nr:MULTISPECIES: SymE family type I addiction module toxin [unclassified Hahella]AZZ92134.1 type I toxin-antitoxin system SymE family toxin [Hahella sp. KA22]MBU6953662.1 type I toxin-antitoxin system SymE family toxin [Hahella sp. HN01]MDG9672166.1 type I toxin-antitoxin system SymE family toxin [Hahella sp. CR1]QAY55505.1 type I addiction module toxin, SymE family [Hahella sp. KA22]
MAKPHDKPERRSAKGKSALPHQRRLKVRKGYYDYHLSSSRYDYGGFKPVPWMLIKGYWLEQAGFGVDTEVEVSVSEGRIVFTAGAG